MASSHTTLEYKAFQYLQHWKRVSVILPPSKLFNTKDKYYPLFSCIYTKTKEFYDTLPLRKNGEKAFIHPINVVFSLRLADVNDPVTLCGGILHDYIEEKVDFYKKKHQLGNSREDVRVLDEYAQVISHNLESGLTEFCLKHTMKRTIVSEIIAITNLLTRYKKNYYYWSISNIFTHPNDIEKERAIFIKLSDRMHNILSIESFTEPERIYQCFKNIFTLNNVKKYVIERYGENAFEQKKALLIVRLFKRCAKATYDAFLEIMLLSRAKGIDDTISMLQLAFKKFEFEKAGLLQVTHLDKKEMHPLRLYTGIIEKYNLRLHHQCEKFDALQKSSCAYYHHFFADYKFTPNQLNAIVDYKDAYSLKEIVTRLLYLPGYVLSGFEYSKMFVKMR
ncbi:hypothetical protein COV17_02390 [Candidatus Woesearchaeota archaeon CG10_big_fil_rev_8_21_14_0_10_36_11]|nr:MAG: hypothetical protein COV17_02390 [Candidatus Woesearchaeota archaeon CG10_big_fil_rev_8_21_14_0_10_36_11]